MADDATFDPSLRDLAERFGSAWDRGDLDAWLACMDPEIEYSPMLDEVGHPVFPGLRSVYRGHDEVRELWHDWHSTFTAGSTLERIGDVWGNECFAELGRQHAVGRAGVTTSRDVSVAAEVRGGLVRRFRIFARWEDALEALGLPKSLAPGPP